MRSAVRNYFRDHQGLEIDLVVPASDRALTLIEAKASRTVTLAMADSLVRLKHVVSQFDVTASSCTAAPPATRCSPQSGRVSKPSPLIGSF
jgi:hypothetical protein